MMFHNLCCWKILVLLAGILISTTLAFALPSKLGTVIGIDLGTTYSCVGVYRKGGYVEIIANDQGNRTTPSWVAFTDTDHLIGYSAKNHSPLNVERTIFDVKRLIGRQFDDPEVQRATKTFPYKIVDKDGKPYIQVEIKDGETRVFSPEEISAMILQKMKEMAESFLGKEIKDAVLTVPAYFNDAQRQATKDAGTMSGLNVVRVIDEPTAAAIGYDLAKKDEDMNILVFHLGGGTFDVTILEMDDGEFEVLATNGDTHLGGEDFDHRVMEYFIRVIKERHGKDISKDEKALGKLKKECERAKRALSNQKQVHVVIDSLFDGIHFSEPLTRAKFEELNMDLFEKTMSSVKKALEDAKLEKNDIHKIVLVGGSTKIPKVQQLLNDFFDRKEPCQGLVPDEAVAYGATVQGAILSGEYEPPFDGFHPSRYGAIWSLGIETAGVMTKLIPRYTRIPTKKSHIITTSQDQQTKVEVKVWEGERKHCRELGWFELSGIPPAPRGVPQIEVTMEVDVDHVLYITAEDKASRNKKLFRLYTSMPGQDAVDPRMLEDMTEEEKKRKETADSRTKLRTYIDDMRIRDICKLVGKIDSDDEEKIQSTWNDALKWLNANGYSAKKDDFDEKRRELEDVCNTVINKAYEATDFKDEL